MAHTGPVQGGLLDAAGQDGPVGDQVGVDARVRLDIGVVGPEEGGGVPGGQRLDPVDHFAPGVEAVAGGALGVLVREPVAHGQQHRRRGVVLGGDELQLATLGRQFTGDGVGHRRFGGRDDLEGRSIGGGDSRFGHGVLLLDDIRVSPRRTALSGTLPEGRSPVVLHLHASNDPPKR